MRGERTLLTRVSLIALRAALATAVVVVMAAGIGGGLVRAGTAPTLALSGGWITHAIAAHAFLLIGAFMGTVIGIERAVAVKKPWAFAAPAASALAGVLMLAGAVGLAAALMVVASAIFVAVNIRVVVRQQAAHTALLLVAAFAWLAGDALFAVAGRPDAAVPWWFTFLVLTIAAERLEMARLMRGHPRSSQLLFAIVAAMLLGSAARAVTDVIGDMLYGTSLVALAVWLLRFDIARRTIKASGLSRYMALCLLLGYAWLALAGAAWAATTLGMPLRDAALHALALGFVFSMMLAHGPVILPAIAGIKLRFGNAFYAPMVLLHASLALRLVGGQFDGALRAAGAGGNALSIILFAATMAGAAWAWRRHHAVQRAHLAR